jgi:hypothetical protein
MKHTPEMIAKRVATRARNALAKKQAAEAAAARSFTEPLSKEPFVRPDSKAVRTMQFTLDPNPSIDVSITPSKANIDMLAALIVAVWKKI